MKKNNTTYWQDVENKVLDPEHLKSEFGEGELQFDIGSIKKDRRSFLKVMGFSFTAIPLASCMRIPVKKAIPYLYKSDQVTPGVANWYATSMDPMKGSSLLVKTREGRPIKIEGNSLSPITKGGTFGTDQASVLSLYNSSRFKGPLLDGKPIEWANIDKKLEAALNNANDKEKKIVLVTRTISSPSTLDIIAQLKEKYSNFDHVVFEPTSQSAILRANEECFSNAVYPTISLDRADLIVSFSADFLGTWLSPVEYTKQYTSRRDLTIHNTLSKHYQFESLMTLTGSNADQRFSVTPEEEKSFIINLLAEIQRKAGRSLLPPGQQLPGTNRELVSQIAGELWEKKGKSVILSGSQNKDIQIMVNALNSLLDNYGETIDLYENPYFKGPKDQETEDLISTMEAGEIGAVLFWDTNLAYHYRDTQRFTKALKKVVTRCSFASADDETSVLCNYVLPMNHFLESWDDYFQAPNVLTYSQPVIQPLFGSRMAQETLLKLAGSTTKYYDFLKKNAEIKFFKMQTKKMLFHEFWNHTVHDGLSLMNSSLSKKSDLAKNVVALSYARLVKATLNKGMTLIGYQKVGMRAGDMINNPWLQELPDPITKATWDNYFLISPIDAKKQNLKTGQVIKVATDKVTLVLPIIVQPGVRENMIGVAYGYGRSVAGKVAKNLGGNAFPFVQFSNGSFNNIATDVKVDITPEKREMALTQTHHSMEGRDIVRETTLKEWKVDNHAGNKPSIKLVSMWGKHDQSGEQWGMAIDLNKCTGCSGCIISCNAENNVPVVGKKEVHSRREMHWLRIDRYYKGDEENPEVVHQPIMCQHCDNAPCETVCPVIATVQSSDGLNQQVYNRCVGTRYCANNCPYKVRRFNWFDYAHDDKYENMVLNPDIVVRSRGVMEKCSMCIQRIQESKLVAKKEERPLKDGDIQLACQQSCPGDAIVFGNLNDPKSKISTLLKNARKYRLLEELNIQPRVNYLTKVRNKG